MGYRNHVSGSIQPMKHKEFKCVIGGDPEVSISIAKGPNWWHLGVSDMPAKSSLSI